MTSSSTIEHHDPLEQIVRDLAAAQQALRRSSKAFHAHLRAVRNLLTTIGTASQAHDDAIDAVSAATSHALQLLNKGGSDPE
jgi:ABC-type transporter Mla subunit MlaD